MRYSLMSRFQGVLLGSAFGEELGSYGWAQRLNERETPALGQTRKAMAQANLFAWQPVCQAELLKDKELSSVGGKFALRLIEELVCQGGWNGTGLARWTDSIAPPGRQSLLPLPNLQLTGAEVAIATLPLMLFFHDNEIRLKQVVDEIATHLETSSEGANELWVVAYAIAQLMKEPDSLTDLLPKILDYQQQGATDPHRFDSGFTQQLERVQALLQAGSGLQMAVDQLVSVKKQPVSSQDAICLALYCFLSTPNDFRLALIRAARSCDSPQLVCGLTGALLGAYSGTPAIPLVWQMGNLAASQVLVWGVPITIIKHLATQLLAVWSGVYDLATFSGNAPAIAAPGVIRLP